MIWLITFGHWKGSTIYELFIFTKKLLVVFGSFFNFLTMHVSLPNLWCFDFKKFMVSMIVELFTSRVEVFTMVDIFTISFVWSVTKLLCLSLKRIWRIYNSSCLQRHKYSCALWDFIDRQAWRIQPSYFCPIWWWFFSKWLLPYIRWH